MAMRIEDYAMIGDCRTAAPSRAMVRSTGCAARGSILEHASPPSWARRRTADGNSRRLRKSRSRMCAASTDRVRWCWKPSSPRVRESFGSPTPWLSTRPRLRWCAWPSVCRGEVPMRSELIIRFDYGWIVPWVLAHEGGIAAIAGADKLRLRSWVPHRGEGLTTIADFTIKEGQKLPFTMAWHPFNRASSRRTRCGRGHPRR